MSIDREQFYPPDREVWRAWLAEHHDRSPGVLVIFYKAETGKPSIPIDEAIDEALCFGWVDSHIRKLDDERYARLFSPRKAKSPWSRINKEKVARLIDEGRMAEAGLAKIEAAKADGSWTVYDPIEDLIVPDDLAEALSENPDAAANFEAFPPSSKKNILWWIASAKRPETRQKRITETVEKAAENKRANHPE